MGPAARGTAQAPASPRPGGMPSARPTSELLGTGTMFQTPEGMSYFFMSWMKHSDEDFFGVVAEALDLWFENLQNYEATLVMLNSDKETMKVFLTLFIGGHGCCLPGCQFQRRTHCHRAMCDFCLTFPQLLFFYSFCFF
jgi:hypothetical protein